MKLAQMSVPIDTFFNRFHELTRSIADLGIHLRAVNLAAGAYPID
jgi:hypothetical protein